MCCKGESQDLRVSFSCAAGALMDWLCCSESGPGDIPRGQHRGIESPGDHARGDVVRSHDADGEQFGRDVADIVLECTDDKSLSKPERKRLQAETAPHKSDRARMLKIADKTSNLRSILASPPSHWDLERKRTYFEWAAGVVAGCRGLNARLEAAFDAEYARRGELK